MPRLPHSLEWRVWQFAALALGPLLTVAVACGAAETAESESDSATSESESHLHVYPNVTWYVPPSLEEQIFRSSVIVRATLQSAAAATEAAPDAEGDYWVGERAYPVPEGGGYWGVQELRFTVHEYLKGSGPTALLVVVRDGYRHATEAAAQAAAERAVAERVTTWDDRQAVLFLRSLDEPYAANGASGASGATPALTFKEPNPNQSAWSYSVDTLSRAWLPARDAGGASGASGTSEPVYITDGAAAPPPVVSLTDLRAQITALAAELKAGESIDGYARCVSRRILLERIDRADPWYPTSFEAPVLSGAAAGTEVYKESYGVRDPKYNRFWLSGADSKRFQARIIDDDDQSSTGYDHALATARPLPAGAYQVRYNEQDYTYFPCNFVPQNAYNLVSVQVTAPEGTVHEAFFDPVAIGSGRGGGRDANGALEPTAFTVGATAVSLQRLSWESRQLQLELSAAVALADHYLDVIALDGSVALRLSLDDATTAATEADGQAWRWRACASPWAAGDQLMLRLHHSATELSDVTTDPGCGPAPTFGAASYAFSIAEDAAVAAAVGTVAATGTGDDAVSYAITAGNDAGAFALDASTGALTVAGSLDFETTTSYGLTVQAVQATSLPATVNVAITITDAAEPPTFGETSYAFSVAEDAAANAAVGTVTATARANGAVSYAITAGNAAGAFAIDASTGAITVAGALDYEATASYTLTVTASHGTSTTTASVAVTVTDVDEPPTFGAANYAFSRGGRRGGGRGSGDGGGDGHRRRWGEPFDHGGQRRGRLRPRREHGRDHGGGRAGLRDHDELHADGAGGAGRQRPGCGERRHHDHRRGRAAHVR